ncbi:MAG: hypothetical protein IKB43_12425 [Fibrobacter sp.]|nr:hypothetical protein [Fibrobacter sp.]
MKRFLLSLMAMSVAFFMACSSDDPAPVTPGSGTNEGGETTPGDNSGSSTTPDAANATYYAARPAPNTAAVEAMYANWISRFYVTAEEEITSPGDLGDLYMSKITGAARIKFDNPLNTVSEGIGYGMLITFFMNDMDKFDRLFKYYKAYPVSEASGMYFMRWNIKGDKFNGGFTLAANGGSATDADLDVVAALLMAYGKTGNAEYKDYALKVAASIYNTEVNPTTHLLMPGNDGKHMNDGYCYNISYFSLVALRLMAKYDTERTAQWNEVKDATLAYMKKVQDAGYGLWPDWSDANGAPIDPGNNSSTGKLNNYFGLEGVRIPLRLIWDYDWYGDESTKALASKAAQYIYEKTGGDIKQVLSRYIYTGDQPSTGLGGAHFRGAFCAVWTVNPDYAASVAACNDVIVTTAFTTANYFEPTLQMLDALYLNGYFKKEFNY